MKIGKRIYYNQYGKMILESGQREGEIQPRIENEIISYIDLDFDDNTLDNVLEYHIDIETKQIVIDKYKEETEEEKLRREKEELENQLLLKENKDLGGIL